MGRSIRTSSLGNKIVQEREILATSICIVLAARGGVDRMRVLECWGGICPIGIEMWGRWRLCLDYIV
jgi:hypothetical protein